MLTLMDTTYIHREPLGVCLVMGAWNYPVQLTLMPVIGFIYNIYLEILLLSPFGKYLILMHCLEFKEAIFKHR